jgi:hypothetical protein
MTSTTPSLPTFSNVSRSTLRTLISRMWAFNGALTFSALLYALLIPIYIVAAIADPRLITGAPAFVKPLKFILSLAIYVSTFLWLLTLVKGRRRWVQIAANVTSIGLLIEIVIITMQAIRGTASHFNNITPLDAMLFSTMGILIVLVAVMNLLLGIWLLIQRMPDSVSAWGVRLGVLISFVGMIIAFLMTSGPTPIQRAQMETGQIVTAIGAHSVGVEDGGPGLPFVGWSTTGGDLRAPHFVGLHAMQVLPLFAFALTRSSMRRRLSQGRRTALVIVGGLGYLALVMLLTWQALRGQPVIAPDALTLSAYTALIGSIALATGFIVGIRPRLTQSTSTAS